MKTRKLVNLISIDAFCVLQVHIPSLMNHHNARTAFLMHNALED